MCYNKTRKRAECSGPTGYTMHILDKLVTDVLHEIFNRMEAVSEDEIISRTHRSAMVTLKERLAEAKAESAKATKDYDSLKAEVVKVIQGTSSFSMDVLSELVENARNKMMEANETLTSLNTELAENESKLDQIKADYHRILKWSEMFDSSDMEVKKMIAGYIIKRVYVYQDYHRKPWRSRRQSKRHFVCGLYGTRNSFQRGRISGGYKTDFSQIGNKF